jgi:transcription antitermination factor NusG
MTWYAVHTRPGWEPAVDRGLKRAGFGTFYPYQLVTRWRKASAGKAQRREEAERPYMPRYLFVACERDDVGTVNRVLGVSTVVHVNGEPLRIPDAVMVPLIASAANDGLMGLDDRTRKARAFKGKVGDLVTLGDGSPLGGLVAAIASVRNLDTKGEISLWLELFGSRRAIPVSVEYVRETIAA